MLTEICDIFNLPAAFPAEDELYEYEPAKIIIDMRNITPLNII